MLLTLNIDDTLYQALIHKVGQENLNQFIQEVLRPQLLINPPSTQTLSISELLGADEIVDEHYLDFQKMNINTQSVDFD